MELEDVDEQRIRALNSIQLQKKRVAKCCNKRFQHRTFDESDLVWKTILPIVLKDPKFEKWSPNWEGPYQIYRVLWNGAYHLRELNGYIHPRKINGK